MIIRSGYLGSLNGMWLELLRFVVLTGAIVVGANVTFVAAEHLAVWMPLEISRIEAIAFFVLTVVAWLLLRLIGRWVAKGFQQHALAAWNQVAGLLLGWTSGVLVAGLVAWALVSIPWEYLRVSVQERSLTGLPALRLIRAVVHHAAAATGGVPTASHFFSGKIQ